MPTNTECLVQILLKYGASSTEEILNHSENFPELCQSCKSGTQIIRAARKLERQGKVRKHMKYGGIIWELIDPQP